VAGFFIGGFMSNRNIQKAILDNYGRGARWIGWNHWLKHQPLFQFIEDKVKQGKGIGNRASFELLPQISAWGRSRNYMQVHLDSETGDLKYLTVFSEQLTILEISETSTKLLRVNEPTLVIDEMFENATHPTDQELDFFEMIYGDDFILVDMNKDFFPTFRALEKARLNGTLVMKIIEEIPF
jgi:hypothetical protein